MAIASPSGEGSEEISLGPLWRSLSRRRWLILGVTAAFMVAAGLITWLQKPIFESEATLLISESKSVSLTSFLPEGFSQMAGLTPRKGIQTDIALLESRQVAEAVVDSLSLQVEVLQPSSTRASILRVVAASRDTEEGIFQLLRQEDGSYTVEQRAGLPAPELPSRVQIGQVFRIGGATLALEPALQRNPPDRIRIRIRSYRDALETLQEGLRVRQPKLGAQILSVSYRSADSLLAAAVPNVATRSFIGYKHQTSTAESVSKIGFLRDQVAAHDQYLREAEARLQQFREREQVVEPRTQAAEQIRQLAELQADRESLQTERESLRRLLAQIEAEPGRVQEQSPYRQLIAFPSFLSNAAVHNVLQHLNELENERATLLVRRTEQNVDVQGINARIAELELQLYRLAHNYLDGVENRLASVDASLARFGTQIERVPLQEVQFTRLAREQKLLEQVYTLLQTSLKEEEIRVAEGPLDVSLVDAALVPRSPVSPRPLVNLILGGMLGLLLGVTVVLVRESSNTRVRSWKDAEAAALGAPVIGMIPRLTVPTVANGRWWIHDAGAKASANGHLKKLLVTRADPYGPAAEAFRDLRTTVSRLRVEQAPQILVVTSATAEEGKSTTAANLAAALAQQGARTLLIDADLRKGMLHRLVGGQKEPGLAEVISGEVALEAAVQHIPVGESGLPLDFVAAGRFPPNPSEALGSPEMRRLLHVLGERYEVVILDTPPVQAVTDAVVLGTIADATLLVARAGVTDREALRNAAMRLHNLRAPLGGLVLMNVELHGVGQYAYRAPETEGDRN